MISNIGSSDVRLAMTPAGTKRRLQVGISQVGNFAGWNFAGWEFCRLEYCRLPGTLQVDDANLKFHHYKVF
jgi:hypothetical protein